MVEISLSGSGEGPRGQTGGYSTPPQTPENQAAPKAGVVDAGEMASEEPGFDFGVGFERGEAIDAERFAGTRLVGGINDSDENA